MAQTPSPYLERVSTGYLSTEPRRDSAHFCGIAATAAEGISAIISFGTAQRLLLSCSRSWSASLVSGEPSYGMQKRRSAVEAAMRFPWLHVQIIAGSGVALALLVWFQASNPDFAFEGKAGFIWLIPPALILWSTFMIVSWPFRRPVLRRELEHLRRYDRIDEMPSDGDR
jgi:hypothetical protein